ncbi:hypothetical protein A1O1_04958, partial [Capronia coronata CBS 617.96]
PAPTPTSTSTEQSTYAFSYPATNTFYTRAQLNEWAQGKVNARGDTVYFRPNFVSDDPWARLRTQKTSQ